VGNYIDLTLPAPVRGLYARSPLGTQRYYVDTPDGFTPFAQNLIAYPDGLKTRGGSVSHIAAATSGLTGNIKTLVGFYNDTVSRLVACTDTQIFDVTSTPGTDITGTLTPTLGACQTMMFSNRLFGVNGTDAPWAWTGTGNAAAAGWTGPGTVSDLINCASYNGRPYFVEKNAAYIWYGAVGAVTGALTSYDVLPYYTMGGHTLYAGPTSKNTVALTNISFCAISSRGEIVMFSGSFPGGPDWAIIGIYKIPKPVNYRSFFFIGQDLFIITEAGIIPISAIYTSEKLGVYSSISTNIESIEGFNGLAQSTTNYQVWGLHNERKKYVLINIDSTLYCYGLDAQAWTSFAISGSAYTMTAMAEFDGILYTGDASGNLYTFDIENKLDITTDIAVYLIWPYQTYGRPRTNKRLVDVKPILGIKDTGGGDNMSITLAAFNSYDGTGAATTESLESSITSHLFNNQWYSIQCDGEGLGFVFTANLSSGGSAAYNLVIRGLGVRLEQLK